VSCAGLILAAGGSLRMGSPKALLDYHGATFLDTLLGLLAGRCSPVIVTLGASAEEVRARTARPAHFVLNPDYARGQILSMQCGLRAVPAETEGVLFTLVDHPAVSAATLDALLRPRPAPAALLRVPRYQGRRGHPIWFARELISEFLALPETAAARDVVRLHAAQTEFLDLDDPGIMADIDDPAAFRALTGGGQ
jgi:CTP:molybdopterin cytidylyltransferase MocA